MIKTPLFLLTFFILSSVGYGQNFFPSTGAAGIGTQSPTHSLTLAPAESGIAYYNYLQTSSNYERVVQQFVNGAFSIGSYYGGTGTAMRPIKIGIQTNVNVTTFGGRVFTINGNQSPAAGIFDFTAGTLVNGSLLTVNNTFSSSTGQQNMLAIQGTVTQTADGGYRALFITPFITSNGNGTKYLIDAGVNSAQNGGTGYPNASSHTSKFTVDQNGLGYFAGNVGFGTASPTAAVDVVGNVLVKANNANADNANIRLLNDNAASTTSDKKASIWLDNNGKLKFRSATGIGLAFRNAGNTADIMDINDNGLSIGTNDHPTGYSFAVNGNGIAVSMTVKPKALWPDYVFKAGYRLPSLSYLRSYIDENHHLPGIPTEQQIKKDGLDLGEINTLLMKKVEELTLYVIQLKEENEKLKKDQQGQIDELKQKVDKLLK